MALLYYYDKLGLSDKGIYNIIYNGLCKYSPSISVDKKKQDRIFQIYQDVLKDHPELSVVDMIEVHLKNTLTETTIIPTYWFPQDQVHQKHMEFLDECEFIANRITNYKAKPYEKERAIYDFLCKNMKYGFCNVEPKDIKERLSQSAFSTLFERVGVCRGISNLFKCIADLVGLDNYVIEGINCVSTDSQYQNRHSWNVVIINSKQTFVDVSEGIRTYTHSGIITYSCFNFSEKDLNGRYTWDRSKYPLSVDGEYGFYETNKLVVYDEKQLVLLIKREIMLGKKIIHFKISRDTYLFYKSKEAISNLILDELSKILSRIFEIRYIADENSGRWSMEVV